MLIRERQAQLAAFVARVLGPADRPAAPPRADLPISPSRLGDEAVIARARAAGNGAKVARLFDRGDAGEYEDDDSRADQALVSLLAFWTRDAAQLDRLFRRSALFRQKWERADYRDRTIAKALDRGDACEPPRPAVCCSRVRVVPHTRGRRPVVDLSAKERRHGI